LGGTPTPELSYQVLVPVSDGVEIFYWCLAGRVGDPDDLGSDPDPIFLAFLRKI
jgi:hypothetical protein